jgi:DNA-binding beta-propeller fold protein YncE
MAALLALPSPAGAQTQSASAGAPTFQLDAQWPKPLPNNAVVGQVAGVVADSRDHVWLLHRPASVTAGTGTAASPVIELDPQGGVVSMWGGPGAGYDWPASEHGLYVDGKGGVWISGGGEGDRSGRVIKFSREGKFLFQIGQAGGGTDDTKTLGRTPADMFLEPKANELYVADGENVARRRVIVFDASTGAFKRQWAAYGAAPTETPAQKYDPDAPASKIFSMIVHCVVVANDGLVYVCDRTANRVQVFRTNGTFVTEVILAPRTLGSGSATDVTLSPDQKFLYVADGTNNRVWILDRTSLATLGSFGETGPAPGQFRSAHAIAADSKGNLYVGEVGDGKRAQKFAPR